MSTPNLNDLFDEAKQSINSAGMSAASVSVMVHNLNNVTLAGAAGIPADDLAMTSATLYVRIIDESASMSIYRHELIDAANEELKALEDSKAANDLLMSTWVFSDKPKVLHSYVPLADVIRLDSNNYRADGPSTALYDTVRDAITSTVAYAQSLRDSGVNPLKVVVLILTDGEDNSSVTTVSTINSLITDLIRQEFYTPVFVAFGFDGESVARQMGIPDGNIMSSGKTASEIRRIFRESSQSVIRTSTNVVGNTTSFFS